MKFYRSFKDEKNIYFVVEYIPGSMLFDVIRELDEIDTIEAQFYTSSIILTLECLFKHQIVYRDLKPENIMVDQKGYVKLIDMGTGKILKNDTERTFTVIGTPHYMAPEILTNQGYNCLCDLWSLGVVLFEMLCGYFPLGDDEDDPYMVYQLIIKDEVEYPEDLENEEEIDFMKILLSKVPATRLMGSFANLKSHSYLKDIDWV